MCEARNTSMRTVPFSLVHDVYVFYLCMPSRAGNCTVDSYTDKCIGVDIDILVDMHSHKQHTNAHAIIHICICIYIYMSILYTCTGCAEGRAVMQACIQHNALCRHRLGCPLSRWRIYGARHVACRAYCSWMNSHIPVARPASELNCCHIGKRAACLKRGRVVAMALAAALLIFCHLGECAAQAHRAY